MAAAMLLPFSLAGRADTAIALSIGAKDYVYLRPLSRSGNDANDVAALFRENGYLTTSLTGSVTKSKLETAVADVSKTIREAKKTAGSVEVTIYYSGHGFEAYGGNWLVGTDFSPEGKKLSGSKLFSKYGYSINQLVMALKKAGADRTVIILDACRERSVEVGDSKFVSPGFDIATSEVPYTFYLLQAAARESYAYDGLDSDSGSAKRNSVFTRSFLRVAADPSLEINAVGNEVQDEVYSRTSLKDPRQLPALYDQIPGKYYLFKKSPVPPVITTAADIAVIKPVGIFFRDERLADAQGLSAKIQNIGLTTALVSDDLSAVKAKLSPGSYRIVRAKTLTKDETLRYEQTLKILQGIPGGLHLTTVEDNQILNKPFQVQLF